ENHKTTFPPLLLLSLASPTPPPRSSSGSNSLKVSSFYLLYTDLLETSPFHWIGWGYGGSLQHTVYISSKDKTFSELEPKLDRGGGIVVPVTVGITVETWLCGFLLPRDYSEEQLLKVSTKDFCVKMFMSTTSL
ncbi:hypothetical protein HID58_018632, partial [Brassica napus]